MNYKVWIREDNSDMPELMKKAIGYDHTKGSTLNEENLHLHINKVQIYHFNLDHIKIYWQSTW